MNSKITIYEQITNQIYTIRGQKIMLDQDLAKLYGVTTKRLNEQVSRNQERFPSDFMFTFSQEEFSDLKSQIATSSWGGRRNLPRAFNEQGIAMLSSVLKSPQAVAVNIQIIRVFTQMRQLIQGQKELLEKLEEIENTSLNNQERIQILFTYLKAFQEHQEKPPIGF